MRLTLFIIAAILIFLPVILTAGEYDDLLFAAGLYSDGNLSLAQQELELYLEKSPESKYASEAKFLLGTIYLETENFKKAKDIFEQLRAEAPVSPAMSDILAGLATAYYGCGEALRAKELLEDFLKKYPSYNQTGKMQYILAKCYLAEGDTAEGIFWLEKALLSFDTPAVRQELIAACLKEGKKAEAREVLMAALEKFPAEASLDYALLLFQQQNLLEKNYAEILDPGFRSLPRNSVYYDQYALVVAIAHFESGNFPESQLWLAGLSGDKAEYYRALNLIRQSKTAEAKPLLEKLTAKSQGEIKANAFFYLATIQENEQQKSSLLDEFIAGNPESVFIAEASFQAGMAHYNQKNYPTAQERFRAALAHNLSPDLKEKAEYLLGEASYQLGDFSIAKKALTDFTQAYPGSSFGDEAYFKLGLSHYHLQEYGEAEEAFKLITYNYLQSDKLGMSNFYLGEIRLLAGETEKARQYYAPALNQKADKELVWLRIAQSWFQEKDLKKAAAALENIETGSRYAAQKVLLNGDIHFAGKEYDRAISAYDEAMRLEKDAAKKDEILARKAWTYYQKGDYNQASSIYNQLSIRTDNPAAYTFQSATALFSAGQYSSALQQYLSFVQNFPNSPDYQAAQVGIADCHYNLQEYGKARRQYRKLLTEIAQEELYNNILDGWKWSTQQSGLDFKNEINDFLAGDVPYNFRFLVSAYKVKFLYSTGDFEECIELIDKLKHDYKYPMRDLEYLRARSLKKLERWEEADDFYSRLFMIYKDADLQYEWAEATLALDKTETSIRKLQYAAEQKKNPDYILQLLELELDTESADFSVDYERFFSELKGISREKAIIFRVKWLIKNKSFAEAASLNEILTQSEHNESKAAGQYLKGYNLYMQGSYEAAIPELLRVRHLFPYLPEVRQDAEEIAFYAYLKSGKKKEAENLLENIKADLAAGKVAELEKMLEEK